MRCLLMPKCLTRKGPLRGDADDRLAAINGELEEGDLARLTARRKKLLQLKEQYRVKELQEKSSQVGQIELAYGESSVAMR